MSFRNREEDRMLGRIQASRRTNRPATAFVPWKATTGRKHADSSDRSESPASPPPAPPRNPNPPPAAKKSKPSRSIGFGGSWSYEDKPKHNVNAAKNIGKARRAEKARIREEKAKERREKAQRKKAA